MSFSDFHGYALLYFGGKKCFCQYIGHSLTLSLSHLAEVFDKKAHPMLNNALKAYACHFALLHYDSGGFRCWKARGLGQRN